jgi:hypothetical protein
MTHAVEPKEKILGRRQCDEATPVLSGNDASPLAALLGIGLSIDHVRADYAACRN